MKISSNQVQTKSGVFLNSKLVNIEIQVIAFLFIGSCFHSDVKSTNFATLIFTVKMISNSAHVWYILVSPYIAEHQLYS